MAFWLLLVGVDINIFAAIILGIILMHRVRGALL